MLHIQTKKKSVSRHRRDGGEIEIFFAERSGEIDIFALCSVERTKQAWSTSTTRYKKIAVRPSFRLECTAVDVVY